MSWLQRVEFLRSVEYILSLCIAILLLQTLLKVSVEDLLKPSRIVQTIFLGRSSFPNARATAFRRRHAIGTFLPGKAVMLNVFKYVSSASFASWLRTTIRLMMKRSIVIAPFCFWRGRLFISDSTLEQRVVSMDNRSVSSSRLSLSTSTEEPYRSTNSCH